MPRMLLGLMMCVVVAACSGGEPKPTQDKSEPPKADPAEGSAPQGKSEVAIEPGKGEPPADPPSEAEAEPKSECVSNCVRDNQMRAVSAEQIEMDCKATCCVSDCVGRNQMRAVSAEQIEADCKGECSK